MYYFSYESYEPCEVEDFWLKVGDRVQHLGDVGVAGTVTHIDDNLIPDYGLTTCLVIWDDDESKTPDIQWTNKLFLSVEN